MNKLIDDERLIIKVCQMYFLEEKNQKDIADELNLSRPTISRIIQNGKKLGIVTISVESVFNTAYIDLARELEKKYGLREVIIVDSKDDVEEQLKEIGVAGARMLEKLVGFNELIGVSMGDAVASIIPYIVNTSGKQPTFVPLVGALGPLQTKVQSNFIAEQLAEKFGGNSYFIHAPAKVSSAKVREVFINETELNDALTAADNITAAIVGIGSLSDDSQLTKTGFSKPEELKKIKSRGAVGDICLQFFDEKGLTRDFNNANLIIGKNILDLKKVDHTVGIAFGKDRAEAIKGAIQGDFIRYLVTDKDCAEELL